MCACCPVSLLNDSSFPISFSVSTMFLQNFLGERVEVSTEQQIVFPFPRFVPGFLLTPASVLARLFYFYLGFIPAKTINIQNTQCLCGRNHECLTTWHRLRVIPK